jgi:hypothetical protein
MLGVTLFGLLLTPVFYWVVRRLTAAVQRRRDGDSPSSAVVAVETHFPVEIGV